MKDHAQLLRKELWHEKLIEVLLPVYKRSGLDVKEMDKTISLITKHTEQYRKMLEKLGIEKCEECRDFCLDWDMTWCETCQKAMHQGTCTGYEYTHPEDGYSVCKECIKDGEKAQKQQLNLDKESER